VGLGFRELKKSWKEAENGSLIIRCPVLKLEVLNETANVESKRQPEGPEGPEQLARTPDIPESQIFFYEGRWY
jgi:hypothetical protein